MTAIWLIVWALSGCNDPVIIENVTTQPDLNDWALWLVVAVAVDMGMAQF